MLESIPVGACLATAFIELDVGAKLIEVISVPSEAALMAILFPSRSCAGGSSCAAARPGSLRARGGAERPSGLSTHWTHRLGP